VTGVYIASPIDQAGSMATRRVTGTVVDRVSGWLSNHPDCAWVFHPSQAFSVGGPGPMTPDIRAITGEALARAGVVVAFLPAGVVSVGVPMEIDRAVQAGKMVLVVSDAPSWMLQFDKSEPNAAVFPEWNRDAKAWLSLALGRATEGLAGPGRASMAVVVDEGAEEPRRGYEDDAGLDLVVSAATVVEPGSFVDIPCGVSVQLPDWAYGLITGRSSTLRKRGLLVNQGIIDAGYRGPLFAGVWNLTDEPVKVLKGERIAQLIVNYNGTRALQVQRVRTLADGSRGTAGFGSTGS
jgi:dUTP pyrophosphatase